MSFQGDYGVRISKLELENEYLLKHKVLALRTVKILKRQSSKCIFVIHYNIYKPNLSISGTVCKDLATRRYIIS